jgi:hypothetical protein
MLLFVLTVLVVQNELLDETRLAHVLLSKRCASENNQVFFFKKNFCIYMLLAQFMRCLIFKRMHCMDMQDQCLNIN